MDNSNLEAFFEISLRRLYQAEKQMCENLGIVAEMATSKRLKEAFTKHMEETKNQMERLKKAFKILNLDIDKTKIGEAEGLFETGKEVVKSLATLSFTGKSKAMQGIIDEGAEIVSHFKNTDVLDLALACGGQTIEMGEISAYSTLCSIAEICGYKEVHELLKTSLEEERKAYDLLKEIASGEIKVRRAAA